MKKKNLKTRLSLKKSTISELSHPEHLKGGAMNSSFAGNCPFGCVPDSDASCGSCDKYCQTLQTIFKGCK